MATGTIVFFAPIAGVWFEPIEVSCQHSAVEKIVLKAQDNEQLDIVFHLTNAFDFEVAADIANEILPSIVHRLAFFCNVPLGEPHLTGGTLPKDASGSSYTVRSDRLVRWDVEIPILALGEDKRRDLTRLLEQPYVDSSFYYSAYWFALNQSDPVARFMFLYSILLQICGDDQKDVDKCIRHCELNVEEKLSGDPKKRAKGVKETVYSRLRNEVSHRRSGTSPEQTRREVQDNVVSFQKLVRTAILRNI